MSRWQLLLRSLKYYRKSHLWVILGTMLSAAILVGALTIGDSVRYSLRQIVFDRLGSTEFALSSEDRFFESRLADDLSNSLGTTVAPLLQTKGIAIVEGGQRRANSVQVVGVDDRFGEIGGSTDFYGQIASDEAIVNQQLAEQLGIKEGDEILLRFRKLDAMPGEAPLSLDSESSVARRFRVRSIASNHEFGKFNLKNEQVTPGTVFISLSYLSGEMDYEGKANVLLVSERTENPLDIRQVNKELEYNWTLADAGLELAEIQNGEVVELKSSRIFLDRNVVDAALNLSESAQSVLTYFVNELRQDGNTTPYSFVSAPGPSVIPAQMNNDEIIINSWLANDLNAGVGDQIRLTYYILGLGRELEEMSTEFQVRSVVPLEGIYADENLLPDFPGIADEENCRDWEPGIPVDLDRIRDKDEEYWDDYRGTPKAFVTLDAARDMWSNRFGDATAVRFTGITQAEIEQHLTESINPASLGFVFRNVQSEGLQASSQSVSFSELFLGLSFFIIIAALLLTSLLFVFNTENRSEENGLLCAIGFSAKEVKGLVLQEGAVLVVIGSLLGGGIGLLYNVLILRALETVWSGAVGTSALRFHFEIPSILIGIVIGAIIAFITIWLVARNQIGQSITGLQRGQEKIESVRRKKPQKSLVIGVVSLAAVLFILVLTDFGTGQNAAVFFFIAGSLLLAGIIAFMNVFLFYLGKNTGRTSLGPFLLGLRNSARKRNRSLTLIGLLACGIFIVFTVGANRLNSLKDAERRDSGTGGFALYGESTIPVLYDLDSQKGREF